MKSFAPLLAVTALLAITAGCSSQDSSFRSVSEETPRSKSASATQSTSADAEKGSANATATSTTSVVLENDDQEVNQAPSTLNVETIIEEPAPVQNQPGTADETGTVGSESPGDDSSSSEDSPSSGGGEGLPGDGSSGDTGGDVPATGNESSPPPSDTAGGTSDGETSGEDVNTTIEMHALCADRHDTTMDKVKVVNGEKSLSLKGDEILLVKVAGNKSKVHITTDNISVSANKPVLGICIFVTGNQAQINADFKIDVGTLSYFGAGNRSSGNITVGEGFQIGSMAVKLRGNEAALKVSGSGRYDCPDADLAGHNTAFTCQ